MGNIVFFVLFAAVNVFIIVTVMRVYGVSKKNLSLPKIESDAEIVSKRSVGSPKDSFATYFITFRFSTGDTFEYPVSEDCYSYFAEGDRGKITVQGTKFISFVI